jgi:mycothiol synthase
VEGLITRAYEEADAAAVAELWNLTTEHAGGHPGASAAEFAEQLAAMVRDFGSDTRLVFDAGGDLVAWATVATPPEGGTHVDCGGGVHPKWRRRGTGRDLVRWQLSRAAAIHQSVAPEREWDAQFDIMAGDADAVRLFERFGLTPVRYWFDMVAPAGPVAAAAPDGLRIEVYDAGLEREVHAVHAGVFAGHWGYQYREFDVWAPMTIRSAQFRPDLSVLALDGDEIVGYVLSYADADPERIYIGQVGVHSRWRRRGVAGGLLSRVLGTIGEAGFRRAGLAVDADSPVGAVGVYERVGFTVESRAVTYSTRLSAAQ